MKSSYICQVISLLVQIGSLIVEIEFVDGLGYLLLLFLVEMVVIEGDGQ